MSNEPGGKSETVSHADVGAKMTRGLDELADVYERNGGAGMSNYDAHRALAWSMRRTRLNNTEGGRK